MRIFIFLCTFSLGFTASAQKKTLDHNVYDGWESIGERKISNNGKWLAYTIDVQEGDGQLILQQSSNATKIVIPRGYNAAITNDNQYAIFLIKPYYKDTREARIKKKKAEDFPKDSLCIIGLENDSLFKIPSVRSYVLPKDIAGPLAYHRYKVNDTSKKNSTADLADEGSELVIFNLEDGRKRSLNNISEMKWSKNGKLLLAEGREARGINGTKNCVMVYRALEDKLDTISRNGNEFMQFAIDDNAYQVAFTAERDSSAKSLQKMYKLWYWKNGMDTATVLTDAHTAGMKIGWTVSQNASLEFSKSGQRLFFGTAPIRAPKDTSLVDIDLVKVDIWHYNDDDLQPQQLKNLERDLKRSYRAMYSFTWSKFSQLADDDIPVVLLSGEGDGENFVGITDKGKRISQQWEGHTRKDIYLINAETGARGLIKKDLEGTALISPQGKYIYWYDQKLRQYFTWKDSVTRNISSRVTTKLYNEDFDMPDFPDNYGVARWLNSDASILVYDRFDIWQLDPEAKEIPICLTGAQGRRTQTIYRYLPTDPDEIVLDPGQELLLRTFNEKNKYSGLARYTLSAKMLPTEITQGPFHLGNLLKARKANVYGYTKEDFEHSPDMYARMENGTEKKLSATNPQQSAYLWGTVELVSWKAYDGKDATGMIFKPENFTPARKYPMISYFYETLSDSLYRYRPPAPVRSRLDIAFFVSRGYLVMVPDIHYRTGYPGRSAYDYIVSGARAIVKKGWADSTKLGLQGQSWGGYQIAYLVTRTSLFAAAWAGAPVANMTSAYGGIRWESGLNRQFQYEKSQSRIGATLWEKQQLYIENSPLFYVPKITTPLVIMSNDDDGAVPWYQGIEMFTAMRRLGKKVWLLNYNGEKHNLEERRNRKDLSIREQQYFDWLLKGDKPTRWITDGVPATEKGRDWGLD